MDFFIIDYFKFNSGLIFDENKKLKNNIKRWTIKNFLKIIDKINKKQLKIIF